MNWNDLKVFLVLLRHGTFAAAGRELGVNPTTVARRLDALEQDVGSLLFSRTPAGLVPTPSAEQIVGFAEVVARQAQLLQRAVGGGDARLAGDVRLAVAESFAAAFLLDHLGAFRQAHPDIHVELNTSDALVDLARGDADVAIRFRRPDSGPGVSAAAHVDVVARRVCDMAVGVFASRAYIERAGCPAHADDVEGYDIIVPRATAPYLPGGAWAARAQRQARVTLRSDGMDTIAAAASAGFGLCAVPNVIALPRTNLLVVGAPVDRRETWLLMPADLRRVARVRALWDFLGALFEQWAPLLSGEVIPDGRAAAHHAG